MLTIAKEFHCSTCAQSFTTQSNLGLHRKQSSECGIVGRGAHGCTGCGAKFQYSVDLTRHGPFCGGLMCTTCDTVVYNFSSWTRHHCDGNQKLEVCCAPPEHAPASRSDHDPASPTSPASVGPKATKTP